MSTTKSRPAPDPPPELDDDLAMRAVLACARRRSDERRAERALLQATEDLTLCSVAAWERQRGQGTTAETLANLKPAFKEDGKITAGNSSQISDGASAVLIMSREKAEELGMKPRARFHAFAVTGTDPVTMLKGPIPATKKILDKTGLTIDDIDLFEVNEAFASVVLAWQKETGADMSKVNVNGGAIALGHPLGASGTKLMATLLNELERTGGRYGLQVMCEGGGMANATIIERLD